MYLYEYVVTNRYYNIVVNHMSATNMASLSFFSPGPIVEAEYETAKRSTMLVLLKGVFMEIYRSSF